MIQGIRRRFILIAVAVLSAAMIALAALINVSNWIQVRNELRDTLADLSENTDSGRMENGYGKRGRNRHMQNTLEESRYFTVRIFNNEDFSLADISRASGESEEEMTDIVRKALDSGNQAGTVSRYMYRISANRGNGTAVFLNIETKLDAVYRLLLLSGIACVGGIAIASLLVFFFSKKAVQPLIRNAIQQKQFITDAGHELKTPLTVISANVDALELKTEPNEWIDSIREQLSGMNSLVSNMIYLSRMDEDGAVLNIETVDFSDIVQQETGPFQGMAEFMGKILEIDPGNGIMMRGDRQALGRMVNQLCDNAIKYSPDGDRIILRLSKSGREIRLTVENHLREPMSEEAQTHLFDRFYRPDASRSRESGGYGIGLSMVKAIAEKHDGSVKVETDGNNLIRFLICFPS